MNCGPAIVDEEQSGIGQLLPHVIVQVFKLLFKLANQESHRLIQ